MEQKFHRQETKVSQARNNTICHPELIEGAHSLHHFKRGDTSTTLSMTDTPKA